MEARDGTVNDREQDVSPRQPSDKGRFAQGKRLLVGALVTMAVGLAVTGSVGRDAGGVVVVVGWLLALAALHRLGRAGTG